MNHRCRPAFAILFLFLFSHFASFGQQSSTPGFIIKQNHDTVRGLIKSVADADLCESVSFKTDLSGEWTRYDYAGLIGFGFDNVIFRSIPFLNTTKGNRKDTIFARQLVSGTYNLFTYMKDGGRFFLLQKDTSVNLLYNNISSTSGESVETGNYLNFLYFISLSCDKLKNSSKLVGYDEKSLADFIQKTNNCISGGSSVSYFTKPKLHATLILFAGGLIVSSQKNQITANVAARLTLPRIDNHVSLNIGFNYSRTRYMTNYNHQLNPNYRYYSVEKIESIPVTLQCNITQSRIQPYFYLGLSGNYSSFDNLATGSYVEANTKGPGFALVGGVGIEVRIIAGLFLRADWRWEEILQYPAVGVSYHF